METKMVEEMLGKQTILLSRKVREQRPHTHAVFLSMLVCILFVQSFLENSATNLWPARKEQAKQEFECLAAQSEESNQTKDQTIRHQTSAMEALNHELKD